MTIDTRSDAEVARDAAEAVKANQWEQVTETHVRSEVEADAQVTAAVEAATAPRAAVNNVITLSSGVKLKLRPVPPLFLRRAQAQIPEPEAPLWRNPANDREEYNASDPMYLKAMAKYAQDQEDAAMGALITTGTVLDFCPEDMPRPEDASWIDNAVENGITYKFKTDRGRYRAWVEDVALQTKEDFVLLGMTVGQLTGISEEDMARAIDTFRGRSERGTVDSPGLPEGDLNGDQLPAGNGGNGAGD